MYPYKSGKWCVLWGLSRKTPSKTGRLYENENRPSKSDCCVVFAIPRNLMTMTNLMTMVLFLATLTLWPLGWSDIYYVTLRLRRKEESALECKEWIEQTNRNWTITRLVKVKFRRIFQLVVVHVIYEPVIVIRTNNRNFECTKNCIPTWNFPHMRFRWNFTILIIIVQYLDCVKFRFAIVQ